MKKQLYPIIGIVLILWGIRCVTSTVSLCAVTINGGVWEKYLGDIVTGAVMSAGMLVSGIMLVCRHSIGSVCTAVCRFMAALALYDIVSSVIILLSVNELMNTPDTLLPGLNSLVASLGFLSVWITFAEAALYIASAAFTVRFFRSGKCFVPAGLLTLLSILFTIVVYHGQHLNVIVLWTLMFAAIISAEKSLREDNVTEISSAGV